VHSKSDSQARPAAGTNATALADRKVMLQKFIFAVQSKVNLSSSVRWLNCHFCSAG